jgi:Protein of unknown function (DUF1045)
MPLNTARYAIYFVPRPGSALAAFGDSLFAPGPALPVLAGLDVGAWIEAPQRYGFHATLKAPFQLRPDRSEADLMAAAAVVAAALPRVQIPGLAVTRLDDFIALTPVEPAAALGRLAEACVRGFEPVRAPLELHDRERRLAEGLSAQEIAYLDTWGYPYVFEGFAFHMSLSGRLAPVYAKRLQRALARHYAAFDGPVDIDAITICRQPSRDAAFDVWHRCALAAARAS